MILSNTESFPFAKTLLIALIGAIIGQSLILIISWFKRKVDLQRKKKMILSDLKNQDIILNNLNDKHLELKSLFEKRETDSFTTSIFQSLHLDIYHSVPKNELYAIFKKNLPVLVDIYKSIEFIKEHGPYWIYSNYLKESDKHLEEKKNETDHQFFCETHLGYIETAIKNIDNNIKTVREIKKKIIYLTN